MSNIQPYIIINGVNSRTISGLLITSLPPISKPQQRTQVETVDGRSGDIITPLGFSAYDKTVSIGLTYNYDIDEIIEFFNTSGTVIFSNEPTKYYRFAIYEQIDFEKLIKFKTAEVVLHVQPYKFSTTEEPLLFNNPTEISIENNGNTDARPNLLITGSGDIDVSLNGSQLLSMDLGEDDQTVIIDSENMNAYGAQSAIKEIVADIEPKQAGSGDPSPDNIREISGYSELNLTRCGVNLFDVDIATLRLFDYNNNIFSNTDTDTRTYINFQIQLLLGTTIVSLLTNATINTTGLHQFVITTSGDFDTLLIKVNGITKDFRISIPFTKQGTFTISFDVLSHDPTTVGGVLFKDMQIETGNTASEYHAYNGSIYNIAFTDGDNPLTVYGGKLNVTTGELTITWSRDKINDLPLSRDSFGGVDYFIYNQPLKKMNNFNIKGDCFITAQQSGVPNMPDNSILAGSSNTYIYIRADAYTTVSAIKEAVGDYYIYYELATPITYQLTPTQINNLLGLNNLYSDTGSLSVKYKSGGVIQTQSGDIVTFTVGVGDMDKGTLLNRLITGNYDKIRLKKGDNVISFTGNVKQVSIDKYSRWI